MWIRLLITIVVGYFLGNLNGAFLMYKLFAHEDIRKSGSGNAGLTNFMRKFGPSKGIWVLLIDIGKAVLACLIGKFLFAPLGYAKEGLMFGALAVSLGHDFPALLGFHGGKGFTSYFGMTLGLNWKYAIILGIAIIIVTLISDYLVMGTFTTIGVSPIALGLLSHSLILALILLVGSIVILYKHQENILRLRTGTEIGLRSTAKGEHRIK